MPRSFEATVSGEISRHHGLEAASRRRGGPSPMHSECVLRTRIRYRFAAQSYSIRLFVTDCGRGVDDARMATHRTGLSLNEMIKLTLCLTGTRSLMQVNCPAGNLPRRPRVDGLATGMWTAR